MRLTNLFIALRNATSYIWRMHDFNYQLPKDQSQDYWERMDTTQQFHCSLPALIQIQDVKSKF